MFFSIVLVSLFILFDLSLTERAILVGAVETLDLNESRRLRSTHDEELIPEEVLSNPTTSASIPVSHLGPCPSTIRPTPDSSDEMTSTHKPRTRHTKKHRARGTTSAADQQTSTPTLFVETEPIVLSSAKETPDVTTDRSIRSHESEEMTEDSSTKTSVSSSGIAHLMDASSSTAHVDSGISTTSTPVVDILTTTEPNKTERVAIAGRKFGRLHHKHKHTTSAPTEEEQLTLEGGDEDALSQSNSSVTTSVKSKSKTEDGDAPAAKSTETEIEVSEPQEPNKPHFKLIYFDARGICESIRLLFRYANQTFVDERISKKRWLAIKDSTFYGKIPILEVDGKPLAQCYAISRYLAKQFGLAGADDWEAAKLDEVADFHKGVHNELSPYIFVLSGYRRGDRDALRKDLFIPTAEKNFLLYVNLLKQSPSGFFGRSGVSWVDFVISEYMVTIRHYEPLVMEKYPLIMKFIEKVQSLPPLKEYIKNRSPSPILQFQL